MLSSFEVGACAVAEFREGKGRGSVAVLEVCKEVIQGLSSEHN
jgi:hypothetical protein